MGGVNGRVRSVSWIAKLLLVSTNCRMVQTSFLGQIVFRNAIEQHRTFGREAIKFLESQSLEVVAATLKGLGWESGLCGYPDAVAELYDLKYPFGGICIDWNQLNTRTLIKRRGGPESGQLWTG